MIDPVPPSNMDWVLYDTQRLAVVFSSVLSRRGPTGTSFCYAINRGPANDWVQRSHWHRASNISNGSSAMGYKDLRSRILSRSRSRQKEQPSILDGLGELDDPLKEVFGRPINNHAILWYGGVL